MNIAEASTQEIDLLAKIVRESNKDVAKMFNLTIENAPKHPSFCESEWVLKELRRGQRYFIYTDTDIVRGCVAYEQPNKNTAYLNRLSVLPEHRMRGVGSKLVSHIIEFAKISEVSEVSIGIIAEYSNLIKWYQKLGFTNGVTQKFDHLPFNVLYMQYNV